MSSDNIVIRVSNLSKCYQIYDSPRDRLKQFVVPRLQRVAGNAPKQYFREFWALRDVSFEVKKGETVGIIGRNGSGKSTLLQMICGTLNPTSGSIQTNGRIAALLELGSGFNPEFTGRENVYMNAAVLGLSNDEIGARFDDIVAFADIGDFIGQPVKTYSSGMMVRLAFAVIAHVDADILVVDEALAVGDAFFTQKCMRFIERFHADGGTLLFVSHDMGAVVNICQTVIMLFAGGRRGAIIGSAETLCKEYLNQIYDDPARHQNVEQQRVSHGASLQTASSGLHRVLTGSTEEENAFALSRFRTDAESFGVGGATIVDAGFFGEDGERLVTAVGGQAIRFVVFVRANQAISHPAIGIMIKDRLGQYLFTAGTDKTFRHHQMPLQAGEIVHTTFRFAMPILIRGVYTLNIAVAEGIGDAHIQHHWVHDAIRMEAMSGPVVHGLGGPLDMNIIMEFFPPAPESLA